MYFIDFTASYQCVIRNKRGSIVCVVVGDVDGLTEEENAERLVNYLNSNNGGF